MFAACSDMNIESRVDSYMMNVNLPWDKKDGEHLTVGAIFAFKLNFGASNPTDIFEKKMG